MITFFVHVEGDNARKIADVIGKDKTVEIDKRLGALVSKVARHIKDRAPKRGGTLRASIMKRKVAKLEYAVQEGVAYGRFQRYGTQAHYIFPVKGSALMSPPSPGANLLHHPLNYVGPPLTALHPGPKPTYYPEFGLLDAEAKIQYFIAGLPDTIFLGMKGSGIGEYTGVGDE